MHPKNADYTDQHNDKSAIISVICVSQSAIALVNDMLEEFLGQKVVVDLKSTFVCLGTFHQMDEYFLELRNADLHDLRDTDTTRELYVADSKATGIKRNRKRVFLVRADIVAVSRLTDVVDE